MPRTAKPKDLSLKGLELFQICAQKGSLQAVCKETGLTASTVSHHLRNLEDHLGVQLFNHSRRPMLLTPKGKVFLRNIEGALHAIRRAKAEASAGNIADASYLRIGMLEDFDSNITPELAVFLFKYMPRCDFAFQTASSTAIIDLLRNRQLELGITANPTERLSDLQETPLIRDPFVVILPADIENSPDTLLKSGAKLPFLGYSSNLIIARQIEAQLKRMGFSATHRFECSNSQTLMAMVASGAGWTITTPLLFSSAKQFHSRLRMQRFPGKQFARTLSIISTPDCARSIVELFHNQLRDLISHHAISPIHHAAPWLTSEFALIPNS